MNADGRAAPGTFDYRQRAAVEFTTTPRPPLPPSLRPIAAGGGFVLVGLVLVYAWASVITHQPIPARRVLLGAAIMAAGLVLLFAGSMHERPLYLTGE